MNTTPDSVSSKSDNNQDQSFSLLDSETHLETSSAEELPDSQEMAHIETALEVHHEAILEDVLEQTASHHPKLNERLKALEALPSPEGRVRGTIAFMKEVLAQASGAAFREFGEIRRLCLVFFKDALFKDPAIVLLRTELWEEYCQLSEEAQYLKHKLDKESEFAVEQLEIAIQVLENEIAKFDETIGSFDEFALPTFPQTLEHKKELYFGLQKQLSLLYIYATKVNELRKELIKTDMRIRQKNLFFKRLAAIGDQVFPARKTLIKEISTLFIEDIGAFVSSYFVGEDIRAPLFVLREEIKVLQVLAKVLTLNTQAFNQTRRHLSECWDKVKVLDKERKKTRLQQKEVFKENIEQVTAKVKECSEAFQAQQFSPQQAQDKLQEIFQFVNDLDVGRDERKVLRDIVGDVRRQVHDVTRAKEAEHIEHEKEKERQKRAAFFACRDKVEAFVSKAGSLSAEEIIQERDALSAEIESATFVKVEKQSLQLALKPLREVILEKQELAILTLPEGDRHALEQLKVLLKQKIARQVEIKAQLEEYRKQCGGFLDFQKAIQISEQTEKEKVDLRKINLGIDELKKKIAKFKA